MGLLQRGRRQPHCHQCTAPNGKVLFLPVAGEMDDADCMFANELGYYWTSEPSEEKGFAHHLFFNDGGRWIDQFNRYLGVQIRPVAK